MLAGLGGEVLEQLQLPDPLHNTVLLVAYSHHHLLLLQSPPTHEKGASLFCSNSTLDWSTVQ